MSIACNGHPAMLFAFGPKSPFQQILHASRMCAGAEQAPIAGTSTTDLQPLRTAVDYITVLNFLAPNYRSLSVAFTSNDQRSLVRLYFLPWSYSWSLSSPVIAARSLTAASTTIFPSNALTVGVPTAWNIALLPRISVTKFLRKLRPQSRVLGAAL